MFTKKILGFSLLLIFSLTSCTKYIGYGVVMLAEDESGIESGSLLKITKESRIRETWVFNTESEEHVEIKKWRVQKYDTLLEAQEFIESYKEYKNYFAIVNKNSFVMRVKPKTSAKQNYVHKKNDKLKIIGRTAVKDEISKNWIGYWWKLITEDGVIGWSFDSYLSIYNGDELIFTRDKGEGPEIHEFFRKSWRPRYFQDMQESRNVNMDKFKLKFKLTTDLDNKEITISMPDHYLSPKFTEYQKTGTYNYTLVGSGVQLDFSRKGSVYLYYSDNLKSYSTEFVNMKDSVVTEIINTENSKRRIKYNEFLSSGPNFKSSVYGNILFMEDNVFRWDDKTNLITKQLLTSNANSTGSVSFKIFIGRSLKGRYEGAMTFDFGSRQELTFLYTFEDGGVRLLYVPPGKIKDNMIKNDDFYSPISLFFTGQQ